MAAFAAAAAAADDDDDDDDSINNEATWLCDSELLPAHHRLSDNGHANLSGARFTRDLKIYLKFVISLS